MAGNGSYLHFDRPPGVKRVLQVCADPREVARHAFYPLIYSTQSHTKLTRKADGTLVKKDKDREISYAAHMDHEIYSHYSRHLSELYEKALQERGLGKVVLAFRKLGKNNIHFAQEAFAEIESRGVCIAVGMDISGFFDNLDHRRLKEQWKILLQQNVLPPDHYNIYKSITKYSRVAKVALYKVLGISIHNPRHSAPDHLCRPQEFRRLVRGGGLIETNQHPRGVPQGTSISCILSNIYMLEFDAFANQWMQSLGGSYRRYCDDMLFICPSTQGADIVGEVTARLENLGLQVNAKKTEVRSFEPAGNSMRSDRPLQYLGFTFDGRQILLRSAALSRQMMRMRKAVRLAKASMHKRNKALMARGLPAQPLYRKSLYQRFSYLGKGRFLQYGVNSAKIMRSDSIRKQVKPLWKRLLRSIDS